MGWGWLGNSSSIVLLEWFWRLLGNSSSKVLLGWFWRLLGSLVCRFLGT